MDRLTIKSPDKDADEYIVPALTDGKYTCTCQALCKDMHFDGSRAHYEKCDIQRAFTLLAAYEDTGLTPEEIIVMKADNERLHKLVDIVQNLLWGNTETKEED